MAPPPSPSKTPHDHPDRQVGRFSPVQTSGRPGVAREVPRREYGRENPKDSTFVRPLLGSDSDIDTKQ